MPKYTKTNFQSLGLYYPADIVIVMVNDVEYRVSVTYYKEKFHLSIKQKQYSTNGRVWRAWITNNIVICAEATSKKEAINKIKEKLGKKPNL